VSKKKYILEQKELNEIMRRIHNPTQKEITDDMITMLGQINSMRELDRLQSALDKAKTNLANKIGNNKNGKSKE
jgi:hypothetical protein